MRTAKVGLLGPAGYAFGADRRTIAEDTIARACNADSAAKFGGVTRIYLTLGDLEQVHAWYVADGLVEAATS